jgi:hypothetical protein
MLNSALALSTWRRYSANLRRFKAYCISKGHEFPPAEDATTGVVASFLEAAT